MNDKKLCESAYLAASDPQRGPYMHGAAMIDRSTGSTHIWLVRGGCSVSVVDELQRQLIKSGRLHASNTPRRPGYISSMTAVVIGLMAAGLQAFLLSIAAPR